MPKLLGLKFNVTNIYTIQNTTLLTRCMRKLLDVNSHSLLTAKVYFLIKWTDKSILCLHFFVTAYQIPVHICTLIKTCFLTPFQKY